MTGLVPSSAVELYSLAAQVVPVLMIALFLDRRSAAMPPGRSGRGARIQRDLYLALCVGAFVVALLVVAGVLGANEITAALVIAALVGCVALLAAGARRRPDAGPSGRDGSS